MTAQSATDAKIDRISYHGLEYLVLSWLLATMSLWVFAFYDVPVGAPDWVRRAQIACFGSNESGLPGAAGWMVLVLSPAAFILAIFITFHDQLRSIAIRRTADLWGKIFIAILILSVSIEVAWVSKRIYNRRQVSVVQQSLDMPSSYPRGHAMAPDFELINQVGKITKLSDFRGRPVLLTFIFAHCSAVCPILIKTVKDVAFQRSQDDLRVLLITLDPWRDTPAALPALAKEWDLAPNSLLLSGNPSDVSNVLDQYKVPRQRDENNGDVIHPALVYLIAPNGELSFTFNNPSATWLLQALARLSNRNE